MEIRTFLGVDSLLLFVIIVDLLLSAWTAYFCSFTFFIDYMGVVDFGEQLYYGERDVTYLRTQMGLWAYGPLMAYINLFLYYFDFLQTLTKAFAFAAIVHAFLVVIHYYIGKEVFKQKRQDHILYCMFVLLLFNDRHAWVALVQNDAYLELFLVLALLAFVKNQIIMGMILYGLAFSTKVGAVMWLPGILLVVAKQRGMLFVPLFLVFIVLQLLALSKPFLDANFKGFLHCMFDAGRISNYDDSLLFSFLTEDDYHNHNKLVVLVGDGLILIFNLIFLLFVWTDWRNIFKEVRLWPLSLAHQKMDPDQVARIILGSAHIAFTFTPQIHKQFICWYAPVFPYLLVRSKIKTKFKVFMLVWIESFSTLISTIFPPFDRHYYMREEKAIIVLLNFYLLLSQFRIKPLKKNSFIQ